MKKQIAIFENAHTETLEMMVNDFINENDICVLDIKPAIFCLSESDGEEPMKGICVIYTAWN